jgi:hypothetical protein
VNLPPLTLMTTQTWMISRSEAAAIWMDAKAPEAGSGSCQRWASRTGTRGSLILNGVLFFLCTEQPAMSNTEESLLAGAEDFAGRHNPNIRSPSPASASPAADVTGHHHGSAF